MAKKTKTKEVKKTLVTKGLATPIKNAEEVKVEEVKNQVEETKKIEPEPSKTPEAPVDPEPVQVKNPEPITPEVVEPEEKKKEETPVPSISAGLSKLAKGDRLDHNHSVDLMKMVHEAYVGNPATPPQLAKAMKQQFDAMALVELMFYNAQLEADFQQLGVKVNQTQFTQMEQLARDMFGITLKGLPAPEDPKQMVINFSESLPKEVKETVKKDIRAIKETPKIPEPNPDLPLTEKLNILRAMFNQIGNGGIKGNISNAIEWSRKAFKYSDNEKKSVILAGILKHDLKTTLVNGLCNMVKGKFGADHSMFGVHAILHQWLPNYSEQEVAEVAQVCLSYKEDLNVREMNERQDAPKCDIDNCLVLINRDVSAGRAKEVINAIINKKDNVAIKYADGVGSLIVNTGNIRKSLISAYGDSDNILKDKLKELTAYYIKPIMRFNKYVDKSAYSA